MNDRSRKAKLQCKLERPAKASEQWMKDFIDVLLLQLVMVSGWDQVQKDKDGSNKYVYKPTEDTLFDFQVSISNMG